MQACPTRPSGTATRRALRSLRIADHARRTLAAGFTTVRDVGGRDHLEFGFRRAVAEGLARSPRLVLAGKVISITTAGASAWLGMYRQADGRTSS